MGRLRLRPCPSVAELGETILLPSPFQPMPHQRLPVRAFGGARYAYQVLLPYAAAQEDSMELLHPNVAVYNGKSQTPDRRIYYPRLQPGADTCPYIAGGTILDLGMRQWEYCCRFGRPERANSKGESIAAWCYSDSHAEQCVVRRPGFLFQEESAAVLPCVLFSIPAAGSWALDANRGGPNSLATFQSRPGCWGQQRSQQRRDRFFRKNSLLRELTTATLRRWDSSHTCGCRPGYAFPAGVGKARYRIGSVGCNTG